MDTFRSSDIESANPHFDEYDDPFNIASTKHAGLDRLRRWRQAALVLNASRRFRYTLDLRKEEEKQQTLRKIRAHAQAIRAAYLFKEAGRQTNGLTESKSSPSSEFGIGEEQLTLMTRDGDTIALQKNGGVKGLSDLLKTNLEKGISGEDDDLLKRRNVFGSNTYPRKKGRSFGMFLWEAWQDPTLIILIVAAVASLALGMKIEVPGILWLCTIALTIRKVWCRGRTLQSGRSLALL